jgi:flagellar biosynthesis protein FlhG
VNLAIAFAQMGKRVAIFDADLGLANVHILMGIKPRFNMRHVLEDNFSLDDVVAEGPLGIKVISGGQGVREMANLTPEQRRVMLRQLDLLERNVDILLIDTGAGISDNVLRFATFADEIVVVTTPNIAAAADGYSIIKILLQMEPKSRIGIVCNQVKNMYHSKTCSTGSRARRQSISRRPSAIWAISSRTITSSRPTRRASPYMLEYNYSEAAQCTRAVAETILHEGIFRNDRKESCFEDLMGALKRSVVGV